MDLSFDEVISRLRAGDPNAADEIFRRYVKRLIALASQNLDGRFRGKADPEGVVQSVYKSFFLRDGHSPFELSDWDSLWTILTVITVRKCHDQREFWMRDKRDVGREAVPPADAPEEWWGAFRREPTSLHALVMAENLERLLAKFKPTDRQIAQELFQGYTVREISINRECSERTVARVSARIKELLVAMDLVGAEA